MKGDNLGNGAPSPFKPERLDSWDEFEIRLKKLQNEYGTQSKRPLLFRGQPDSTWKLETTLERRHKNEISLQSYYRLILANRPEIESLAGLRWKLFRYPTVLKALSDYDRVSSSPVNVLGEDGYEYMIYLRHHGFPSPFLDWSRSPYVAAYFAFSGAGENKYVSIYVMLEPDFRIGGSGVPYVYRLGHRVRAHRRHFLQQSNYTMCLVYERRPNQEGRSQGFTWSFSGHESAFWNNNEDHSPEFKFGLWKFDIPSSERVKVLRMLDSYNLNAFSLFGSEEGLMETMARRSLGFEG